MPVVQKKTYMLPDGTYVKERDLDQWTPESGASGQGDPGAGPEWRQWSYYKLQYKEID